MEIKKTDNAAKPAPKKKKLGKSLFRRVNDFLHLWLGLISGLIVCIVSLTGCIYVFQDEIRSVTQTYQFVQPESKAYLPPSELKTLAEKHEFGVKAGKGPNKIAGVTYLGTGKAAVATYRDKEKGFMQVFVNPYSGEVLHTKALEKDFFRFILEGHYYLWLPHEVGKVVVAWAVGIFVILLITGIIMWWPKNLKKANRDKSFKVKWKASFKRVNYDLHNVLGFYVWIIALIIAVTGLYWGFKWVPKAMYWVASAGKTLPERRDKVLSDTSHLLTAADIKLAAMATAPAVDKIWMQMNQEYKGQGSLSVSFPAKQSDVINVNQNPGSGTFYKAHTRYFDQYNLAEIKGKSVYSKKYENATGAEKLIRMNYDIHVGAILGIPGKIMAFFASLICGSLPITGLIIWLGKKKKSKKKTGDKKRKEVLSKHAHEHKQEEPVLI
jgi:uncharacterized iron-regulated membrane protein